MSEEIEIPGFLEAVEELGESDEDEEEYESEFGAGIVVCLVKFTEHLGNRWNERILHAIWWLKLPEGDREKQRAEAALHPHGDAARRLVDVDSVFYPGGSYTDEQAVSSAIELWMNGASDHFYGLDRENAPQSLNDLADLCLAIGHGFTGAVWGQEHLDRIYELWKEAILELDEMLGVKPDWGQW